MQISHADGLLPVISFSAGLLNQGVYLKSNAYTTNDDIQITADDGITLAANIFALNGLKGLAPAGHRLVLAIDTQDPEYKSVTSFTY